MGTKDILSAHDIKPTIVRMKIYDYLVTKRNHPTADQLYKSLSEEIPTLSKTSVYNTVEIFAEKNLIQTISIEDNECRYDADISDHGHFKCTECSGVFDFKIDLSDANHNLPPDFRIIERHVYFKGKCADCRHKPKS